MTYANMTAQELHDLVTRLEAHGFKVRGLVYRNLPPPHNDHYKPYWAHDGTNFGYPVPFAAAIIEVAAREWWLSSATEQVDRRIDDWSNGPHRAASCETRDHRQDWAEDVTWSIEGCGPTPLHAIAAALEAK